MSPWGENLKCISPGEETSVTFFRASLNVPETFLRLCSFSGRSRFAPAKPFFISFKICGDRWARDSSWIIDRKLWILNFQNTEWLNNERNVERVNKLLYIKIDRDSNYEIKQTSTFSTPDNEQSRNLVSVVWIRARNRNECETAIQSAVDRESRGAKGVN